MKIIVNYFKNKMRLKKLIVGQYLVEIKKQKAINEKILSDPKWASDFNSEYHRECRLKTQNEIVECDKQIRMLEDFAIIPTNKEYGE